MFRRIELIEARSVERWQKLLARMAEVEPRDLPPRYWKHGLCGVGGNTQVHAAWIDMVVPRKRQRHTQKNCRYFFTEAGWNRHGRAVVAACLATGQPYRVLAVEEHEVDVLYHDALQVAVRPKRKRK